MKVIWTKSAVQDLRDLENYIAADSPLYARRFVERLLHSTRKLRQFKQLGRRVAEAEDENIRELIVRPYRIVYRLRADQIEILGVVHGKRDLPSAEHKPWESE